MVLDILLALGWNVMGSLSMSKQYYGGYINAVVEWVGSGECHSESAELPWAGRGPGSPGRSAAPTPQVIAFPSRDFVSVAEPGGTTPTTTWTHPASPVQTSTSTAPGLATALGLVDITHVLAPCWSSPLSAPTSNMSPGDTIAVTTAGAANQQLSMSVADVTTAQARLAAGSSTKVVVTGSAKDPASGLQLAPGLVQVRLIAKKAAFSFNGRRDLTAVLGGGKDGVFAYNTPGAATDFTFFTATFEFLGGKTPPWHWPRPTPSSPSPHRPAASCRTTRSLPPR